MIRPKVRLAEIAHQLRGQSGMTSQSVGGLLGAIVAVIVLGAAVVYGPIGQMGKPAKPPAAQPPAATA
ncbi:hypothetical protein CWO89_19030, partial [Bradyrhizobium sp. Leo170]